MRNVFIITLVVIILFSLLTLDSSFAGSLGYSTYLGGSGNEYGYNIAVDNAGNAYIVGYTNSPDFPTTLGAIDTSINGLDAYITKLNPSGTELIYSTCLGGAGMDIGISIALDSIANAYIVGWTASSDFPITSGAFDTSINDIDAFVSKLNPSGTALVYSTYLGGSSADYGQDIAIDSSGNIYICGETESVDFPITSNAFDTTFSEGNFDIFVCKFNTSGTALIYSTYLGGGNLDYGYSIAVDNLLNTYIAGRTNSSDFPTTSGSFDTTYNGGAYDAYVSKLNPSGTALIYSTYIGDSTDDECYAMTIDDSGNAYLTGKTNSINFPTTAGAFDTAYNGGEFDAFICKVNTNGSGLIYSTYLGGIAEDYSLGVIIDNAGYAYISGSTFSQEFPTTTNAFDTSIDLGSYDVFISKLNPSGTVLIYSTFLGGDDNEEGYGIAIDGSGNAYVTGMTRSSDFPTTLGAVDTTFGGVQEIFVTKITSIPVPIELSLFQVMIEPQQGIKKKE